jgi:hypothetical protein
VTGGVLRAHASPVLVGVWRHPWVGASVIGLLGWFFYARTNASGPLDNIAFAEVGRAIWHGHLDQALAEPSIQSGPLTLALLGALDAAAGLVGDPVEGAAVALSVLTAWCMTAAVRLCSRTVDEVLAGAGLLGAWVLALVWDTVDGSWGHPSHAIVPLLWLVAVRAAQQQRVLLAGAALGLAAAFDTWGALGACALLVLWGDGRALLRAGASAVAVAAVVWLPFLVTGSVRSGDMRWPTETGSFLSLLGQDSFGASYRLPQALAVIAVGAVVSVRLRHASDLAWLLPVVLVTARIATDGQFIGYYANPATVGLLVGCAVMIGRNDSRVRWVASGTVLSALHLEPLGVILCATPMVVGAALAVVGVSRPRGQLDAMLASARSARRYESTPNPAMVPVATADTTDV